MATGMSLIGRETELSLVVDFLNGEGGLLIMSGEAGVGKSRLLVEARAIVVPRERLFVWARPEQVQRPGPFALILDLLENMRDTLEELQRTRVENLIGELTRNRGESQVGEFPGRRVATEIRGILGNFRQPIIVAEDLHAADEASQAVLLHLSRTARDDGHYLVATYRSEEALTKESLTRFLGATLKDRLAREITLSHLDLESSRQLVRSLRGDDIDDQELNRIVKLAEGIAYYLEELSFSPLSGIPSSIARTERARLQQLSPFSRLVIETAALSLGALDVDVLTESLSVERSTVVRALVDALQAGILVDRNGRLLFRHALIREALVDAAPEIQREESHRRIAEAIEKLHAGDPLQEPALAYHWYSARNPRKALGHALEAGRDALLLAAVHEAREAYQLGLACTAESQPSAEALLGLAECDIRSGLNKDAADLLLRAIARFQAEQSRENAVAAMMRLAWVQVLERQGGAALATIDDALALSRQFNMEVLATRVLARKAQILFTVGNADSAQQLLLECLNRADSDQHQLRAECLDSLGLIADHNDDFSLVAQFSKEACAEALAADDAELIGKTHNNRALWLILRGDVREGLSTLRTARDFLQRSFGSGGLAIIDFTEAVGRWRLGEPDAVQRLVGRHEVAWARFRGYARILQAWAAQHLGDADRASHLVEQGWAQIGMTPQSLTVADVEDEVVGEVVICHLVVAAETETSDTTSLARMLVRGYSGQPADERALIAALLGRIAAEHEDWSSLGEAIDYLDDAVRVVRTPYFEAAKDELMGHAFLGQRDDIKAVAAYESAVARLTVLENVVDRTRCSRGLARALVRLGSQAHAVSQLRASFEVARQAGATLEGRRVESELRALGIRPRAGRPRKSDRRSSGLSAREEEIAALVAAGATNAEIGSRLFLSERTVQDHISHALRKLTLPGRAALAAWAVRERLL